MRANKPPATGLLEQLSLNSTPYHDPLGRVGWNQLTQDSFWLPETAVSLYGLKEYTALPLEMRQALSHYEFINFIQAGLWLEGIFMERISRSLRRPDTNLSRLAYRLHELREEAGHSLMFLELLQRANLKLPRRRFHRLHAANFLGHHAPFQAPAFWIAVLIGEEVPDRLNRFIRKHRDQVCPAIYDMATVHTIEEARHIVHARSYLDDALATRSRWWGLILPPLIRLAARQFIGAFYYPAADTYELAGLRPGNRWAVLARHNPHHRRFIEDAVRPTLRFLNQHGLNIRWR